MSKLLSTSKSQPCPICGKTNGNCRFQSNGGVQCMTYPDGDGDNAEYRWIKPTEGSYYGGIHHLRKDGDYDPIAQQQRKAEREAEALEVERQRRESCLSPIQRDNEIKSILSQLTLTDGDRHYLESRGISAGIIGNCRSVAKGEYGQKLTQPVHVNLPGAWKNGKGLSVPYTGILVPIPDHLGRFTALRIHDPTKTQDGKYKWLSSASRGITPNLPNGELPAATHYPNEVTKPGAVGLVEGMEWKAGSAANHLGFPCLGFSGHGAMANSPQQIQALLDHTGAKEIFVIPDANCLTNDSVNRSVTKTIDYWVSQGYAMTIAWWGQTQKSIGDIDEIDGDRLIEFISPKEFKKINGATKMIESINSELSPEDKFTELLSKDGTINELIQGAVELFKGVKSPIDVLESWIDSNFEEIKKTDIDTTVNLIGGLNSEYGNKSTRLLLAKALQTCSPLIKGKAILSNLKDIYGLLGAGAKVANPPKTEKQIAIETVEKALPGLRFNQLTKKVECNGQEFKNIELAYLRSELVETEISKNLATDAIQVNAHKNEYHPFRDYLESLKDGKRLSDNQWNNLAFHLLGTDDKLAQIILRKSIIATVARNLDPGCYVRMIPVLQGDQNAGKSTFLRLLAGDAFFCDSLGKLDNPKDDYQLLHSYVVHEWAEVDKLNKKSAGDVKAFITKTKDDFRAPYARSPETHLRQCVIYGTCNRTDFLKDSTGNTRFSVIEIKKINLELTKEWRDSIWATAQAKYLAGESWELTQAEQALSEINNESYTEQDPWLGDVEAFISQRNEVSLDEVFDRLEIDKGQQNSLSAKRLRDCLQVCGWVQDKGQSRRGGVRTRRWRPAIASETPPNNPQPPTPQGIDHYSPLSQLNCTETATEPPTEPSKILTPSGFQASVSLDSPKNTKNNNVKTPLTNNPTTAEMGGRGFSERYLMQIGEPGETHTPPSHTGQGLEGGSVGGSVYESGEAGETAKIELDFEQLQSMKSDSRVWVSIPTEGIDGPCYFYGANDLGICRIGGLKSDWAKFIKKTDIDCGNAKFYSA